MKILYDISRLITKYNTPTASRTEIVICGFLMFIISVFTSDDIEVVTEAMEIITEFTERIQSLAILELAENER